MIPTETRASSSPIWQARSRFLFHLSYTFHNRQAAGAGEGEGGVDQVLGEAGQDEHKKR